MSIYNFGDTEQTRIVRGSDYSPASGLSSRVRKTMTGNNPKLDLANVDAKPCISIMYHQYIINKVKMNLISSSNHQVILSFLLSVAEKKC